MGLSSRSLLRQYIKNVTSEPREVGQPKRLWVFDFDDTLVKTDGVVHVTNSQGESFDLLTSEYAVYKKKPDEVFDYRDFQVLINPRMIKWMSTILRCVYTHHGAQCVVILSARGSAEPIIEFLAEHGITDVEVAALGNSDPTLKAQWVSERLTRDSLDSVEFFDDSHKNIEAISGLRQAFPDVNVVTRRIVHNRISSLHD